VERKRPSWTGVNQKVSFLKNPRAYPDNPENVEVIETHKSWVFLTEHHAYKLKKPVRYNSIDFRPLDARCADCKTEVILNRRLAGDVYIGVEELRLNDQDELSLDGSGTLVDCVVKMKRLPAHRMLSSLIEERCVRADELRTVATKLARFYKASEPVLTSVDAYREHLLTEMQANVAALSEPVYDLPIRTVEELDACQRRLLTVQDNLIGSRVVDGRIVDGHGDLRPEHICVLPEPIIFDCLEFDARLRMVDPIDELSFLALECERIGDASVGPVLFSVYEQITGDSVSPELVAFYMMYRACMWARLAIWRTRELEPAACTKWITRATAYLEIAEVSMSVVVSEVEDRQS
jgi:uncharacterized protein